MNGLPNDQEAQAHSPVENGSDESMHRVMDVEAVFADAVAVWHMHDLGDTTGKPNPLKTVGAVELACDLSEAERAESIHRGGDGKAALFDGTGWLVTENETEGVALSGEAFSIAVRLNATEEGGIFYTNLFSLVLFGQGLLIGLLGTGSGDCALVRDIPMTRIAYNRWHDLVVRLANGRLECFVDGALMDRLPLPGPPRAVLRGPTVIGAWQVHDPPLPAFPASIIDGVFTSPFHGRIDHAMFWNRALTDEEIAALSGVEALTAPDRHADRQKAINDYRAFHDASRRKDVAACEGLGLSMRRFLARDARRPIYHLTAPLGFLSDPSGAIFHQGTYHVFSYRNIMVRLACVHLDHYVSDDLVHWKDRPVAAWADSDLDVYGIWLTNNFIDDDGVPAMIYTAHGRQGKIGVLARSRDGLVSYGEKEAVMADIIHHDGHTWKDGDTWYTLTTRQHWGKRPGELGDEILILSSPDLRAWTERGVVFSVRKAPDPGTDEQRWGFTEFPYLVPFGEKCVLMTGTRPTRYWVGHYDKERFSFVPDAPEGKLLDYLNSVHCFNPLTVDDKGPGGAPRRIIHAMHLGASGHVDAVPWNGLHVLPRVLSLQGDRLVQQPVPEVETLRGRHVARRGLSVGPGDSGLLGAIQGDALEIVAAFEPGEARRFGVKVRTSRDGRSSTRIFYDTVSGDFGAEGNIQEPPPHVGLGSGPAYIERGQPVVMRIFLDKCLLEVFVNGHTCSGVFSCEPGDLGVDLFSDGAATRVRSLDVWEMKSAWSLNREMSPP